MAKPKLILKDRNGVLTNISKRTDEFDFVNSAEDSDCIVTWQDVRGEYKKMALINKAYLHRPFIVAQHGRACVRDYGPPENFKLLATKFCCWGQDDYDRMKKLGYEDRTVITGCPLLAQTKPKVPHRGKNILFVPVITDHEEPDNLITFWELRKLELKHSQNKLRKYKDKLKAIWNPSTLNPSLDDCGRAIPYDNISEDWHLISKVTPLHDTELYTGSTIVSHPGEENHTEKCVDLLAKTDVVVCVEEGTLQVLTMAMDIPLIVVKGFELNSYSGLDYSKDRVPVHTEGATWVELSELEEAVERELADPGRLSKERKEVVRREFGGFSSDPNDNIVKVIKESIQNG